MHFKQIKIIKTDYLESEKRGWGECRRRGMKAGSGVLEGGEGGRHEGKWGGGEYSKEQEEEQVRMQII